MNLVKFCAVPVGARFIESPEHFGGDINEIELDIELLGYGVRTYREVARKVLEVWVKKTGNRPHHWEPYGCKCCAGSYPSHEDGGYFHNNTGGTYVYPDTMVGVPDDFVGLRYHTEVFPTWEEAEKFAKKVGAVDAGISPYEETWEVGYWK